MSLKFGDHVVLIHTPPGGKLERVNAIVLRSAVQPQGGENASPKAAEVQRLLKDRNGKPLPGGEYLDLAYPNLGLKPDGQPQLTSVGDLGLVFKHYNAVPPYTEGSFRGWELPGIPSAADLDAVAKEAEAKAATSGKVRQIKGK